MSPRIAQSLTVVGAMLLALGCARSSSLTEVSSDGAWKRAIKLSVSLQDPFSMGKDPSKPSNEPKIEDFFNPPTGPGWKVERTKTEDNNLVLNATRSFKAGEISTNDVVVKGSLNNSVTVRELGNGRFEYSETFHWTGKKQSMINQDPRFQSAVREALGAALADQATVDALGIALMKQMLKSLFGPGDPLIGQLMLHPEMAERRLKIQLARSLDQSLTELLGTKMDPTARQVAIRKMLQSLDSKKLFDPEKKAQEPAKEGDNQSLISMFMSVKLPGTIVESNGETDPLTGEVFWAMYPEAASMGDIELRAVCEVKH